jgi:hypothetical protein
MARQCPVQHLTLCQIGALVQVEIGNARSQRSTGLTIPPVSGAITERWAFLGTSRLTFPSAARRPGPRLGSQTQKRAAPVGMDRLELSRPRRGWSWYRVRRRLGWLAGLTIVGIVVWAALWSVERPRAGYDSLWYSMYTYQYAGTSVPESWDRSWDLVVEFADPALVQTLHREPSGAWFSGFDDPTRQRWIGIYRMRPIMPLLGAVAYPALGTNAPLVASAAAVDLVVLVAGLVLPSIAGWPMALLFLLLTAANPLVAQWLIFLTPDGLGIAFWFLTLALLARYVHDGHTRWLAGATGATLLLAFTRPSAVAIPLTMAICAIASMIAHSGPWRRFAAAAALTALPIVVYLAYAAALGLPSFADQLQDLPTDHFARPDIANPIQFLVQHDVGLARRLLVSLPGQPQVWLSLLGAALGFLLTRRWWTAPFVVALATVPLLVAVHPVSTEVARSLAPGWISLNVGLALLAATGVAHVRLRTLRWSGWRLARMRSRSARTCARAQRGSPPLGG